MRGFFSLQCFKNSKFQTVLFSRDLYFIHVISQIDQNQEKVLFRVSQNQNFNERKYAYLNLIKDYCFALYHSI